MAPEHATVAEEEDLESLFWLFEAGLPMTGANLARAMQLSAPTVHEMVGRLERDGYITRNAGRAIQLTSERRGNPRPRDAARGPGRARDGRPPRARRLHHPQRRPRDRVHLGGPRARRADR